MPTSGYVDERESCPHYVTMVRADPSARTMSLAFGAAWTRRNQPKAAGLFGLEPASATWATFLRRLVDGVCPPSELRTPQPWAFVGTYGQEDLVAVASIGLASGLFYCQTDGPTASLVIGLDTRSVAEATPDRGGIDPSFLHDFLHRSPDVTATPLSNVRRLVPGTYLRWRIGEQPEIRRWWPVEQPDRGRFSRGTQACQRYIEVFDATVSELMAASRPLAAELSGGLDSTFMLASLARQSVDAESIHAYTYRPVPGVPVAPPRPLAVDDSPWATAFADGNRGKVRLEFVTNDSGVLALDAAREASARSWWPMLNPCNQWWMDEIKVRVSALGSSILFSGSSGNYSFSHGHPYALAETWQAGRALSASRGIRNLLRGGVSPSTIAALAVRSGSPSTGRGNPYLVYVGDYEARRRPPLTERHLFLDALFAATRPFLAALNPRANGGLLVADPFLTPAVVEAAAAIDPVEWWNGPWPRGLARTLAKGRVPDMVRLRTQRGGQGVDTWWHARKCQARYHQELELLAETPWIKNWVHLDRIARTVDGWPWGQDVAGPSSPQVNRIDRILNLAGFVRDLSSDMAGVG